MSRLFLGNVPYNANESEILDWIQAYGFMVESVDIIMDRHTGSSRGFCFASLIDGKQTESAVRTLNGKIMGGRAITVNLAVPLKNGRNESPRGKAA